MNNEVQCFSKEVCEQLGFYVYRLIDPRNGNTFYVGKGKNNRVFAHANDCIKENIKYIDNENYFEEDNCSEEYDSSESLKTKTIKSIHNAGLKVITVIHRYGIKDEETAYEIESAVMDCYQGLSNIQNGYHHDRGLKNTQELEALLNIPVYEEDDNLKYIIIKTSEERRLLFEDIKPNCDVMYEATRYSWKINPKRAKKCKYVFGVIDGIVRGIYQPKEWVLSDNGERYEFIKEDITIDESVTKQFLGKRIPEKYRRRGMSNPVLYHD